jgi:hypothetical protein
MLPSPEAQHKAIFLEMCADSPACTVQCCTGGGAERDSFGEGVSQHHKARFGWSEAAYPFCWHHWGDIHHDNIKNLWFQKFFQRLKDIMGGVPKLGMLERDVLATHQNTAFLVQKNLEQFW